MDQRRSAPHPFSRPPSSQPSHDPRFAPIPPPPYTPQPATHRPEIPPAGDPFFRRRNEHEDQRSPPTNPTRPYTFPIHSQLNANLFPGASDFANIAQPRRNSYGSATPFDAGPIDRYGSRISSDLDSANISQQTLPPPPPPPSAQPSSYGHSSQLRNLQGEPTRQMINRPASPTMLEDQPLPPPPPFNGRHMLPPSSPQTSHAQQGLQLSQSHRPPPPPPPPPFSANRELPALSTAPRPGSSMSISSMLGTDPGRLARETIAYSNPPSTIISTTASPSIPTKSPSRLHHNAVGNSQSHSPERYKPTQGVTARPHRAFSGGSPQRPTASAEATVSEISNFGATPSTQPPRYSPLSETGSRQDWKDAHGRHQSAGRIMQRPNSQPSGYSTSLEVQDKMQQHSATSEIDELRRLQSAKRYLGNTDDNYRATAFGQARRDYIVSRAMPEPEAVPPPERKLANTSAHTSPKQDRLSGSNYSFLTKSSTKTEATTNRVGLQAGSILNRVLERNPPVPPNLSQSPFSPESLRRLREERLVAVGSQHNGTSQFPANQQTRFVENADARQDNMYPRTASVPANLGAPSTIDGVDHQTRTGEEMNQLQKSSLSLFMENQKRGGRVSPLPQAVQGAQGKLSTPASDPGIKSEFARMFIGIGSGVGSAGPMRSETSTPFQRSPIRNHEPERRTPFGNRSDLTEFNKPRARSRNTKRPKKSKEDDLKLDVDGEGRASTGIISSRGIKRNKSNNYHPHNHGLDEQGNPIPYHHHHQLDQKHRRTPQPKLSAAPPVVPPRMPKTTINNDSLLDSIRHLPRHHLGSTLYCPSITSISSTDFHHNKLGYTSTPKPIARFDGQENCTFTVRVPRYYLTPTEREDVCRRRTLWGSDVYTDDSDPLAAAIHAGWIRGDWGDDIDLSMLCVDIAPDSKPTPATKNKRTTEIVSCTPPSPIIPPIGKDLHLTLLILPTLESYASTAAHGIKSRAWGRDHDGVSFKIERMAWVDEGVGRAEERGGAARRKRMRFGGLRTGLGPGIKLPLGKRKRVGIEKRGASIGVGVGIGVGA